MILLYDQSMIRAQQKAALKRRLCLIWKPKGGCSLSVTSWKFLSALCVTTNTVPLKFHLTSPRSAACVVAPTVRSLQLLSLIFFDILWNDLQSALAAVHVDAAESRAVLVPPVQSQSKLIHPPLQQLLAASYKSVPGSSGMRWSIRAMLCLRARLCLWAGRCPALLEALVRFWPAGRILQAWLQYCHRMSDGGSKELYL